MRQLLIRFIRNRRGAIAYIFAGCLLPLVMLIGLSIDYSFYVQARSQFGLAADAAAVYALREGTAVYSVESQMTSLPSGHTASGDAVAYGHTAGDDWFNAQLGTLPTAKLDTSYTTNPDVELAPTAGTTAGSSNAAVGCPTTGCTTAGFTATATYHGTYPPFFNGLFRQSSNWTFTGTSGATTQYNYLELLVLMDDSGSMLVSADQGNTTNANGTTSGNYPTDSDPGTVGTMDLNTVCMPNNWIDASNATPLVRLLPPAWISYYEQNPSSPFITWSNVARLTNSTASANPTYVTLSSTNNTSKASDPYSVFTSTTTSPACAAGTNKLGSSLTTNGSPTTAGSPYSPCAFACHTAASTANHQLTASSTAPLYTYVNNSNGTPVLTEETSGTYTYPNDLYGVARQLGVKLKIDTVFQSTESMIKQLQNTVQVPAQFAVGMYAFDGDACPIVNGLIEGSGTYSVPEATTDLSAALSAVEADDYTENPSTSSTPGETAFPTTVANNFTSGNTNFPYSMSNLMKGTMNHTPSPQNGGVSACASLTAHPSNQQAITSSTSLTSSTGNVVGSSASNPQRDVFIITDGVEDSYASSSTTGSYSSSGNGGLCPAREGGEMTSVTAEENGTTTVGCDTQAVCSMLKSLGFTIYVLYVPYPATQHNFYYTNQSSNNYVADPYITNDATYQSTNKTGITLALFGTGSGQTGSVNTWNNGSGSVTSPDQQALTACASKPADFYTATTSAAITTEMQAMLQSALSSAIRITQ